MMMMTGDSEKNYSKEVTELAKNTKRPCLMLKQTAYNCNEW